MSTSALHVARTGLDAQNQRIQIIANNLANVNTTGFKRDRASFETLAYQMVVAPGASAGGDNRFATGLNLGTGAQISGTSKIQTQGAMTTTNNALDLAIEGAGYFQVQMPSGQIGYTRAGAFNLSAEGTIVTADGMALQPEIQLPDGVTNITIAADGTVSAQVAEQTEAVQVGQIETATFVNPAGLQAVGNNLLVETASSGAPQVGPPGAEGRGNVRAGALEASNVNIVEELVDMIETQRAYEVNSRMIQSISEMMQNATQQL
jgi:flagellar basal-body rod protein FlgG